MTRLKTGAPERAWEAGTADGVRSSKGRDIQALGASTGGMAMGLTTRDAVGFLATPTEETELEWPGELREEQTAISLF